MGLVPHDLGRQIFKSTRVVNEANGIVPFRVVILDGTDTPGNVSPVRKIKYPTITISNGERVDGVCYGPVNTLSGSLAAIAQNKDCEVVNAGEAAIMCDTTVDTTNILLGDLVASSETATQYGMIHKAALTNNYPTAGQHVVGRALNKATVEGQFVLVMLAFQEV